LVLKNVGDLPLGDTVEHSIALYGVFGKVPNVGPKNAKNPKGLWFLRG
jgi:hypothetical protein